MGGNISSADCEDECAHAYSWPMVFAEEWCLFNFEQFWKIRKSIFITIRFWWHRLVIISNIICSIIGAILAWWILDSEKTAQETPCAEQSWIWTFCLLALLAPIAIAAVAFFIKYTAQWYRACRRESAFLVPPPAPQWLPGGPDQAGGSTFLFLNLVHPIGRSFVSILGLLLWTAMPEECSSFYQDNYPDLLLLFHLYVAAYFLSAGIGFFTFIVALLSIQLVAPRYITRWLSYLEDLTPFNFYRTHITLTKDGAEDENEDVTGFQMLLLILNAVYWTWGVAVLFQDEESRSTACHAETPLWAYVISTLLLVPAVGLVVVLLRLRNKTAKMPQDVRARWDLLLAIAHPLLSSILAVAGVAMWLAVSEHCSAFYSQVHPDLLSFFIFQVVVMVAAGLLGLAIFYLTLVRRAVQVYESLIEQEDLGDWESRVEAALEPPVFAEPEDEREQRRAQ